MRVADTRFVWADIETTGLLPMSEDVLEVGFRITDMDLNTLDEFDVLIWEPGFYDRKLKNLRYAAESGDKGAEYVLEMHNKSGLWDLARTEGMTLEDGEREILAWLASHGMNPTVPMGERDPICGNSIQFDRGFLVEAFPGVLDCFSYRNVDVSTLKELCRRLNPSVYARLGEYAPRQEKHRALADLDDSIAEFRFYRDNFLFVPA